MKHTIITPILVFIHFQLAFGQIDFAPHPGNGTWCPGESNTWTSSVSGTGCGTRTWTITNGKFQTPQGEVTTTTGPEVNIKWDDIASTGKLKVSVTCGTETHIQEKDFAIRSLKDRVPANPRAYQLLAYCDVATITVAVDIMPLLNTGGTTGVTQQYADGYEWVLPTGWKSGGTGGTITSTAEFIGITPDNWCVGGTVTVKAYKDCTSGKKYSSSASISVNRTGFTPFLSAPTGYAGPRCGDKNPVTFTAKPLSCATSYRWTATNTQWKDADGNLGSWTTPGNTITLTPTGSPADNGVLSVDINIGCGTLVQTRSLTYTDPLPANPTISKSTTLQVICAGESWTFTNTPPSGYPTNYGFDWYATGGLRVNGGSYSNASPLHTTSNTVTISATSGSFGTSVIWTRLNNIQCTPSNYVWMQVQAGPYGSSQFNISGPSTACPNTNLSYLSTFISPNVTNYQWGYSGVIYQGGQGTPYYYVATPVNFNYGTVTLRLGNRCGLTGSPRVKTITKVNCFSGFSVTASPNPATNTLSVSAFAGDELVSANQESPASSEDAQVTLLDKHSLVVRSGKFIDGKLDLDVSQLPDGIYVLQVIDGKQTINERILVKH